MTQKIEFKVLIEQDEDGFFVASVPSLPGCHSQGLTLEEALDNIKDAIQLCLKVAEENPSYNQKVNLMTIPSFLGITSIELNNPLYHG